MPLNINENNRSDSPISIVYGNPDIPDKNALKVNGLVLNLIILSNSSETREVLLRVEVALSVLLTGMRRETHVLWLIWRLLLT